jgi:hypothetical protein
MPGSTSPDDDDIVDAEIVKGEVVTRSSSSSSMPASTGKELALPDDDIVEAEIVSSEEEARLQARHSNNGERQRPCPAVLRPPGLPNISDQIMALAAAIVGPPPSTVGPRPPLSATTETPPTQPERDRVHAEKFAERLSRTLQKDSTYRVILATADILIEFGEVANTLSDRIQTNYDLTGYDGDEIANYGLLHAAVAIQEQENPERWSPAGMRLSDLRMALSIRQGSLNRYIEVKPRAAEQKGSTRGNPSDSATSPRLAATESASGSPAKNAISPSPTRRISALDLARQQSENLQKEAGRDPSRADLLANAGITLPHSKPTRDLATFLAKKHGLDGFESSQIANVAFLLAAKAVQEQANPNPRPYGPEYRRLSDLDLALEVHLPALDFKVDLPEEISQATNSPKTAGKERHGI